MLIMIVYISLVTLGEPHWHLAPPKVRSIEADFQTTYTRKDSTKSVVNGWWKADWMNYREIVKVHAPEEGPKVPIVWATWDGEKGYIIDNSGPESRRAKGRLRPVTLLAFQSAPQRYVLPFDSQTMFQYCDGQEDLIIREDDVTVRVANERNARIFFRCRYQERLPHEVTTYVLEEEHDIVLDRCIDAKAARTTTFREYASVDGIAVPVVIMSTAGDHTLELRLQNIKLNVPCVEEEFRIPLDRDNAPYYDGFKHCQVAPLLDEQLLLFTTRKLQTLLGKNQGAESDEIQSNCATGAAYLLLNLIGLSPSLSDVHVEVTKRRPQFAVSLAELQHALVALGASDFKPLAVMAENLPLVRMPFIALLEADSGTFPGHFVVITRANSDSVTVLDYPERKTVSLEEFRKNWKGRVLALGVRRSWLGYGCGILGIMVGVVLFVIARSVHNRCASTRQPYGEVR